MRGYDFFTEKMTCPKPFFSKTKWLDVTTSKVKDDKAKASLGLKISHLPLHKPIDFGPSKVMKWRGCHVFREIGDGAKSFLGAQNFPVADEKVSRSHIAINFDLFLVAEFEYIIEATTNYITSGLMFMNVILDLKTNTLYEHWNRVQLTSLNHCRKSLVFVRVR